MSDIKIFVSHRIDKESRKINNALFYPMRCGAVFDGGPSDIPGDDTGDNISQKRDSFCELTVLYWAWKNAQADYYGLCHYRRYFSFADQKFPENSVGCVVSPEICEREIEKSGMSEENMRKKIEPYDLITTPPVSVAHEGCKSVYDFCLQHPEAYFKEDVDITLKIVDEKYPDYSQDAREFFNSGYNRWYNCNIMKRELFRDYCAWLFDILFELEKRIDFSSRSREQTRVIGVMGERLFGVYYTHLLKQKKYRICERQLVYFENTEEPAALLPAREQNEIPVVLFGSNDCVPYCLVFMQSILEHASKADFYDFIIFEKEMSAENKEAFAFFAQRHENVSVRFYNPRALTEGIRFHGNGSGEEAYGRLLVPYALPHYDKVLCLDSDMIAKSNLAELFRLDISGYLAGAAADVVSHGRAKGFSPEFVKYCKTEFRMKDPLHSVDTGVLVLNLKEFREAFRIGKVMKAAAERPYKTPEQDVLNLLLEGRIKYLDPAWNLYAYCGDRDRRCVEFAPLPEYNRYMEARRRPKIIHYAGAVKPWQKPDGDFALEFWETARGSPQYETIVKRYLLDRPGFFQRSVEKSKSAVQNTVKKLFPWGTRRHALLKRYYYKLRGWT